MRRNVFIMKWYCRRKRRICPVDFAIIGADREIGHGSLNHRAPTRCCSTRTALDVNSRDAGAASRADFFSSFVSWVSFFRLAPGAFAVLPGVTGEKTASEERKRSVGEGFVDLMCRRETHRWLAR
jgi:hypothetical protein